MNIVFNIRTVLAYSIIMVLVVIPQLLLHFGLEHEYLTGLTSMWAIFIIILMAEFILFFHWFKNIRMIIFAFAIAVAIAFVLTSFFGA